MDGLATLIRDISDRFKLGVLGRSLVQELLRVIANPTTGGPSGVHARFERAGLGDLARSWLGNPRAPALTVPQLRAVLGEETLAEVARFANLEVDRAAPAAAVALPRLIGTLSPGGHLPSVLPESAQALLAGQAPLESAPVLVGPSAGKLAIPALALLLVGLLAWWFACDAGPVTDRHGAAGHADVPPSTATQASAPQASAPAVELTPARLSLSAAANGVVEYAGRVRDEATRGGVLEALRATFGGANLKGFLTVDPDVGDAHWLSGLKAALPELKLPGLQAVFEGMSARVGGLLPEDERDRLLARLRGLFGQDIAVAALGDRFAEATRSANERTQMALTALKPGFSAPSLVRALNLSVINFATGSAELPADAGSLLDKVAAALRQAPAGTRIEVAGHTDNTGDAATNGPLSQARAEAVRDALLARGASPSMLEAKGYGSAQPIAPNDTEDGRFHNRRIEFILIQQAG